MMNDHIDGLSFQKLGVKYDISKTTAYRCVVEELSALPKNNQFSHTYCVNFSDILVADAKYVQVKGHERGLAFLWGVDYLKHDFPIYVLAPSENYDAWSKYFFLYRILNHHYRVVVADELLNIHLAAKRNFPECKIQICYNHVKENIRRTLKVRTDSTYQEFVHIIEELLSEKRSIDDWNNRMFYLFKRYQEDEIALSIIMALEKKKEKLRAFENISRCPVTTNMIEGFNSHLESRLASIRAFESYAHADLWLNGYILKRRYTKFRDCKQKFKHFNGHSPLEFTTKKQAQLPSLF